MYDPVLIQPFRDELVRAGFVELRAPQDVDKACVQKGTVLLVINSVCGCAAGSARPGVRLALAHPKRPEHLVTVFAGQDREATNQARAHIPYPPSSPAIALFRDGHLVFVMHRSDIEGRPPEAIAAVLDKAFEQFC